MKLRLLLSLSYILLFTGCAAVQPGNDKLVVRAEQARASATETFNILVQYEYTNRAALWKVSKDIKHTADGIRAYGKLSLQELTVAIDAYKAAKSSATEITLTAKTTLILDLAIRALTVLEQGKAALK